MIDWFHLFVDNDTRLSGHIGRPTQVRFSHSCFKLPSLMLCQVVGIDSGPDLHHLGIDLDEKSYLDIWPFISDKRIQFLSETPLC